MKKIITALLVIVPAMFLSGCVTETTYSSGYNTTTYYPRYNTSYVYGGGLGYTGVGFGGIYNTGYYGNRWWYGNNRGWYGNRGWGNRGWGRGGWRR
ncbi:hypothetical protein [Legionella shakespearei]|uniref:Uncharacterized protein n=1 Tax=Legionella shakespearei DSM 23087 TaxID=1122169 RepID=A0A0W0YNM2_9GAMM|nr:hypothetical protein [Legionella shakespearei]KTD58147.1 hypothetical protein Lsha_2125 [Legionella shakespearei DSM 23087]